MGYPGRDCYWISFSNVLRRYLRRRDDRDYPVRAYAFLPDIKVIGMPGNPVGKVAVVNIGIGFSVILEVEYLHNELFWLALRCHCLQWVYCYCSGRLAFGRA